MQTFPLTLTSHVCSSHLTKLTHKNWMLKSVTFSQQTPLVPKWMLITEHVTQTLNYGRMKILKLIFTLTGRALITLLLRIGQVRNNLVVLIRLIRLTQLICDVGYLIIMLLSFILLLTVYCQCQHHPSYNHLFLPNYNLLTYLPTISFFNWSSIGPCLTSSQDILIPSLCASSSHKNGSFP